MLLSNFHFTHEAAEFVEKHVEKLTQETKEFVEVWKEQLVDKHPYLEDPKWFNKEKIGWSDDRWRPNMSTPVIGLDRDGTINEDIGTYVTKPEQFTPIPGSLEAVKMIRDKGYDVVILTTQAGIVKGICDAVDVDVVPNYMLQLLGNVGCKSINGLYYSTTNFKDDIYAKPKYWHV